MINRLVSLFVGLSLNFAWPIHSGFAQGGGVEGAALADLYLQAIVGVTAADKRGARNLFTREMGLLQPNQRTAALSELIAKLRANDIATKADILTTLQTIPVPWSTQNTGADADFIYSLYGGETNPTTKSLLDGALANAQGLYRDGISDYNTSNLEQFPRAAEKLKRMLEKYPQSEYAENASFYLGQYYVKALLLQVAPVDAQLAKSNEAFEQYIAAAEANRFVTKNFLAAGYFFRGLNGWIGGSVADAKHWLDLGGQRFSDSDVIYVYQLFFSLDHNSVIDKFLPAKSLFTNTSKYIGTIPPPTYNNAAPLISALRQ